MSIEEVIDILSSNAFLHGDSRLGKTDSRREIGSIDSTVYDLEKFNGILVAKFGEKGFDLDEVEDYWQNKREVRNFIEAQGRDSNIFPKVLGGRKDFSVIVSEHKIPLFYGAGDFPRHPDWDNWIETDSPRDPVTDWGIDVEHLVPLDHGKVIPQDEYRHADGELTRVLENSEMYHTESDEYFHLENI